MNGKRRSVPAALTVAVIAAAAVAALTPAPPATSAARTVAPTPIKHVVVVYLENHSFDNLLGYWCHSHPGRCPDGGMPSSVTLSSGARVTPDVMPDVVPVVSHNTSAQIKAINGGAMNGWQHVAGCSAADNHACIGGYTPAQIPNTATLASDFAISDATFSMAASPSWETRLYTVTPSTDGFQANIPQATKSATPGPGWGCNSDKTARWVSPAGTAQWVPSCIPDYKLPRSAYPDGGAFERTPVSSETTILDELQTAGRTWKIYGEPKPEDAEGKTNPGYIWDVCPSYAQCLDTSQQANNVAAESFIPDAAAGKLPSFSLVIPGGHDAKNSEHNGYSMTLGDDWVGQLASAVMKGPDWKSTVMFITYDECGCFYDQVPPGTNPDGTAQGPRLPLIIASPYVRPGYTDNTRTTYAGVLAYIEHTFGLGPLGVNDARAYGFSQAFDYTQAPLRPRAMVWRRRPKGDHIDWAQGRQDS